MTSVGLVICRPIPAKFTSWAQHPRSNAPESGGPAPRCGPDTGIMKNTFSSEVGHLTPPRPLPPASPAILEGPPMTQNP